MNRILKTWSEQEFIDQYWTTTDNTGCKWLAYDKFIAENPCEFNILIGDNGISKSWSLAEAFFQGILDGRKQIWGRIRASEKAKCVQEWIAIFERHGIIAKNGNPKDKVEWSINGDGVWKYEKLVMPFVYMTNIAVSQPSFEGLQRMVIDEILWNQEDTANSRPITFKNPIKSILLLQDRARVSHQSEVPTTYLIANLHQPQSDFFSGLQYFPNWTKLHNGESELMIYKTPQGLKVSVIILGTNLVHKASEMNWKIRNQLEREQRLNVKKYAVPSGALQKIYECPDDFEPQYNFNWMQNSFTVGTSQIYNSFYVMKKPDNSYDELPWYSILVSDHTAQDLFLCEREDMLSQFYNLLRAKHNCDNIRYDAPFTQENVDEVLNQIEHIRLVMDLKNKGTH